MWVVTNLPQYLAQVERWWAIVSPPVLKQAAEEAIEIFEDEWKKLAPYLDGHYQESLRAEVDVQGKEVVASVYPHRVAGVPEDEQPYRYASKLEFGGMLGPNQRNAFIPAQPSMRPAFESKKDEAEDAAKKVIGKTVLKLQVF